MSRHALTPAILICGLVFGCAHYPVNPPLARYDPTASDRYQFSNLQATDVNSDDVFVVLAFSGGGTRAAAFSYGVMEELRDTAITINGQQRRLLDEVDVISSVSGGSFTAAYYALFGDQLFSDFEPRFLKQNMQRKLVSAAANPVNWWALASPNYGRIDLAAELYDKALFRGKTFADLVDAGRRPYVILNATDMSVGSRFEFTQQQFDLLHSDLSSMRVARAVAASSAFPFLLCPLTINNYHVDNGYEEPIWVDFAMEEWEDAPARYDRARLVRSYLNDDRDYVHLLDGGLSDNIGLRGPWQSAAFIDTLDGADTGPQWHGLSIRRMLNTSKINTLIVIIVNARTESTTSLDKSSHTPGLISVAMAVATGPMENYSSDTVQLFRQEMQQWAADQCALAKTGQQFHAVKYLDAEISFEGIADPDKRSRCKSMGTNYCLSDDDVDLLKACAGDVMNRSEQMQLIRNYLQDYHTPTTEPSVCEICGDCP